MAPEQMRTAKDLAQLTGFSYRQILNACAKGELEGFRPSGNGQGTIYITDSAWSDYLERIKVKTKVKGRPSKANPSGKTRPVSELALV